ncbi:Nn.00g019890.m01.CDS01 [Neocucurbitaria sp. VM-36]
MHFVLSLTAIWLSFSLKVVAQNYRSDVNTVKNCTIWYDNSGDDSCKDIRDSLGIKPETFTRWNPSITLDCGNWQLYTSYCTWVESEQPTISSSATTASSTTPTPTTKPSPSSWKPLGCWPVGAADFFSLEKRVSVIPNNTPAKCQDACYKVANTNYRFAGMAAGSQCWCSDFVRNDMSANGTTDCNIPCAGETTKTCGGANSTTNELKFFNSSDIDKFREGSEFGKFYKGSELGNFYENSELGELVEEGQYN